MSCEAVCEFLLQTDWNAEERAQAAEFLRHLDQCDACRAAMQDFDEVSLTLAPIEPPEPTGGWDAMKERMIAPMSRRRHNWFIGPAAAMAASVALAIGMYQIGRRTLLPAGPVVDTNVVTAIEPAVPSISSVEVVNRMQAFRAASETSEGRANWLVKLQNGAEEVHTLPAPLRSKGKMLVLRMRLLENNEVISKADLVVLSGQQADLDLPLSSGRSLHYRIGASNDEPTRVSLWLEMSTPERDEPMAMLATNLRLEPGGEVSAGRLKTTIGDYELKIDFAAGGDSKVSK